MAFYTYNEITGNLIQISDEPLSPETNIPVSFTEISKRDLLDLYQWDKTTFSFVDKTDRILNRDEFLNKFTVDEYSLIQTTSQTNEVINYYWSKFMNLEYIDLDDIDTIRTINILEQYNLLTENRVLEILS